jgi:hypothetical protein
MCWPLKRQGKPSSKALAFINRKDFANKPLLLLLLLPHVSIWGFQSPKPKMA